MTFSVHHTELHIQDQGVLAKKIAAAGAARGAVGLVVVCGVFCVRAIPALPTN